MSRHDCLRQFAAVLTGNRASSAIAASNVPAASVMSRVNAYLTTIR